MGQRRQPSKRNRNPNWEKYYLQGLSPLSWYHKSLDLKRAAEHLVKRTDRIVETSMKEKPLTVDQIKDLGLPSIYLMLMAYALESILKGIYMSLKPESNVQDLPGKSHELNEILDKINDTNPNSHLIKLDKTQKFLLDRLSEHSRWIGKYPVPTTVNHFLPKDYPGGGYGPMRTFSSSDPEDCRILYSNFEGILNPIV